MYRQPAPEAHPAPIKRPPPVSPARTTQTGSIAVVIPAFAKIWAAVGRMSPAAGNTCGQVLFCRPEPDEGRIAHKSRQHRRRRACSLVSPGARLYFARQLQRAAHIHRNVNAGLFVGISSDNTSECSRPACRRRRIGPVEHALRQRHRCSISGNLRDSSQSVQRRHRFGGEKISG